MRLQGINPTNFIVYSQGPHAEVSCLKLILIYQNWVIAKPRDAIHSLISMSPGSTMFASSMFKLAMTFKGFGRLNSSNTEVNLSALIPLNKACLKAIIEPSERSTARINTQDLKNFAITFAENNALSGGPLIRWGV